jgi:hypothetical protein
MRVRPPPSSTLGSYFSGQADLKSQAKGPRLATSAEAIPWCSKRSVRELSERIFALPEQQV